MRKKVVCTDDDIYTFEDDSVIRRERETLTPNGNKMNGRWVYRSKDGTMLDYDQYINDLACRFKLDLYS